MNNYNVIMDALKKYYGVELIGEVGNHMMIYNRTYEECVNDIAKALEEAGYDFD